MQILIKIRGLAFPIANQSSTRDLCSIFLAKVFLFKFGNGQDARSTEKKFCGTGKMPVPNYYCKKSSKLKHLSSEIR